MPTKIDFCNMVVEAWNEIPSEVISKSFRVCGQVSDVGVEEIVAFKEASGRAKLIIYILGTFTH